MTKKKPAKKGKPRGNYQKPLKINGDFNEILKISGGDKPTKKVKKK